MQARSELPHAQHGLSPVFTYAKPFWKKPGTYPAVSASAYCRYYCLISIFADGKILILNLRSTRRPFDISITQIGNKYQRRERPRDNPGQPQKMDRSLCPAALLSLLPSLWATETLRELNSSPVGPHIYSPIFPRVAPNSKHTSFERPSPSLLLL